MSPTSTPAVDLEEIRSLEADLLQATGNPTARAVAFPAALNARRHALLARHLGFTPAAPLPLLHVLGDSHAAFFAGAEGLHFHKGRRVWTGFLRARYVSAFTELLPVFRVFHVGPATAWQVDEPGSSTRAHEKIRTLLRSGDLPQAARVLLVFGEIDCRCHIPKAVLGGTSIKQAVTATVDRFMRLPRRLKTLNRAPAVWLPSLAPQFGDATDNSANQPLPIIGSQSLRDEITATYCETLRAACAAEGIHATGIAPPPVGEGLAECFLDVNHLSQRVMPAALAALVQAGILPLASKPGTTPI